MADPASPRFFPPPSSADRNGLVDVDPHLDKARLLDAYQNGIFPWPTLCGGQWHIGWHSPDPRAILPLGGLHVPRRLIRKLRLGKFRFSWDTHFDKVIDGCANIGDRAGETWLCRDLIDSMNLLHQDGYAHSLEVYDESDEQLIGGLYGIATGSAFSAESMFYVQPDASKAAVCVLVTLLGKSGFQLLDIQQNSPHLQALGAIEIDRDDYLQRLAIAVSTAVPWPNSPSRPMTWNELFA